MPISDNDNFRQNSLVGLARERHQFYTGLAGGIVDGASSLYSPRWRSIYVSLLNVGILLAEEEKGGPVMPCSPAWDSEQHLIHDENVEQVLAEGESAISCAHTIEQNFREIARQISNIAKACGAKGDISRKLDPRLHVMLGQLEKIGRSIFKVPMHKMSHKEVKAHHDGLEAILPLLKDNAAQAGKLAQYWNEMHNQLTAVAGLFVQ